MPPKPKKLAELNDMEAFELLNEAIKQGVSEALKKASERDDTVSGADVRRPLRALVEKVDDLRISVDELTDVLRSIIQAAKDAKPSASAPEASKAVPGSRAHEASIPFEDMDDSDKGAFAKVVVWPSGPRAQHKDNAEVDTKPKGKP